MSIIVSERLKIDKLTQVDASFLHELMNSPGRLKYIGNRAIHDENDALNYLTKNIMPSYETNGFGLLKVSLKKTSAPIGICGLLKRTYLAHPDLGFALLPKYYKQGFTYEASEAILAFAKNTLKEKVISAITIPTNKASMATLLKLGFAAFDTIERANEYLLLYKKQL